MPIYFEVLILLSLILLSYGSEQNDSAEIWFW